MEKKVYVLTYCTSNSIGSILQSYALTQTLKKSGYSSRIWLTEPTATIDKNKRVSLKTIAKQICKIPYKSQFNTAQKKRHDFISKHIDVEYLPSDKAYKGKALENQNAVYLAGSDQIWNPNKCNPLFFLDFVSNSPRVSYAASMGQTQIPPDKEEQIANMIRSFDRISVREQECVNALQKFTDQEISVHVDPTFLIDSDKWRELEKPRKIKGPYILLYMLYWDKSCKDEIIALKKRTGLPVYAICPDISRAYADHRLYDVGVEEFLWLVDHAEYVVTSSFHGVAFSILFCKKFAAVINPKLPSRIRNVLDVLSVPLVSINELDSTDKFTYDTVFEHIEKERQRSIEYLKETIG